MQNYSDKQLVALAKSDAVRTSKREKVLSELNRRGLDQNGDPVKDQEAETPEAETPEAETPEAETPETETPEAETPEAETPEAETPEAETPEAETPEAEKQAWEDTELKREGLDRNGDPIKDTETAENEENLQSKEQNFRYDVDQDVKFRPYARKKAIWGNVVSRTVKDGENVYTVTTEKDKTFTKTEAELDKVND